MSDTIRVKPKEGYIVRDPGTHRPLAIEGENKPRNQYWQRRLRDGDVVLVEGEQEQSESPPATREA